MTGRKVFGVAAGIVGISLIIGLEAFDGLGQELISQLAIVVATISYACAAIFGRGFKGLDPMMPAAGSLICGAILLIPVSLVVDQPWTDHALGALDSRFAWPFGIFDRPRLRDLLQAHPYAGFGQHHLAGLSARADRRRHRHSSSSAKALASTAWIGLICVIAGVAAMTLPSRKKAAATA